MSYRLRITHQITGTKRNMNKRTNLLSKIKLKQLCMIIYLNKQFIHVYGSLNVGNGFDINL